MEPNPLLYGYMTGINPFTNKKLTADQELAAWAPNPDSGQPMGLTSLSKWDGGMHYYGNTDPQIVRGTNIGFWDRAVNAGAKFLAGTPTKFMTMLNIGGWGMENIAAGKAYRDWEKSDVVQNWKELDEHFASDDWMPVTGNRGYQLGGLGQKLLSNPQAYLANEFNQGLQFFGAAWGLGLVAGTAATATGIGAVVGAATGGLAKAAPYLNGLRTTASGLLGASRFTGGAARAARSTFTSLGVKSTMPNLINKAASTAANTIGEAGWEALEIENEIYHELIDKINPSTGEKYSEEDARNYAKMAGERVFNTNTLARLAPNWTQSSLFFGRGVKGTQKALAAAARNKTPVGKVLSKELSYKSTLIKNALSEGLWEENVQEAVGRLERGMIHGNPIIDPPEKAASALNWVNPNNWKDFSKDYYGALLGNMGEGVANLTAAVQGNTRVGTDEDTHATSILTGMLIGMLGGAVSNYKERKQGREFYDKYQKLWGSIMGNVNLGNKQFVENMVATLKPTGSKKITSNGANGSPMSLDVNTYQDANGQLAFDEVSLAKLNSDGATKMANIGAAISAAKEGNEYALAFLEQLMLASYAHKLASIPNLSKEEIKHIVEKESTLSEDEIAQLGSLEDIQLDPTLIQKRQQEVVELVEKFRDHQFNLTDHNVNHNENTLTAASILARTAFYIQNRIAAYDKMIESVRTKHTDPDKAQTIIDGIEQAKADNLEELNYIYKNKKELLETYDETITAYKDADTSDKLADLIIADPETEIDDVNKARAVKALTSYLKDELTKGYGIHFEDFAGMSHPYSHQFGSFEARHKQSPSVREKILGKTFNDAANDLELLSIMEAEGRTTQQPSTQQDTKEQRVKPLTVFDNLATVRNIADIISARLKKGYNPSLEVLNEFIERSLDLLKDATDKTLTKQEVLNTVVPGLTRIISDYADVVQPDGTVPLQYIEDVFKVGFPTQEDMDSALELLLFTAKTEQEQENYKKMSTEDLQAFIVNNAVTLLQVARQYKVENDNTNNDLQFIEKVISDMQQANGKRNSDVPTSEELHKRVRSEYLEGRTAKMRSAIESYKKDPKGFIDNLDPYSIELDEIQAAFILREDISEEEKTQTLSDLNVLNTELEIARSAANKNRAQRFGAQKQLETSTVDSLVSILEFGNKGFNRDNSLVKALINAVGKDNFDAFEKTFKAQFEKNKHSIEFFEVLFAIAAKNNKDLHTTIKDKLVELQTALAASMGNPAIIVPNKPGELSVYATNPERALFNFLLTQIPIADFRISKTTKRPNLLQEFFLSRNSTELIIAFRNGYTGELADLITREQYDSLAPLIKEHLTFSALSYAYSVAVGKLDVESATQTLYDHVIEEKAKTTRQSIPTSEQKLVIKQAIAFLSRPWIKSTLPGSNNVVIKGIYGSGKTLVAQLILKTLKYKNVVAVGHSQRSTKNIVEAVREATDALSNSEAYTLDDYINDPNKKNIELLIIDEAFAQKNNLLKKVQRLAEANKTKILYLGDSSQNKVEIEPMLDRASERHMNTNALNTILRTDNPIITNLSKLFRYTVEEITNLILETDTQYEDYLATGQTRGTRGASREDAIKAITASPKDVQEDTVVIVNNSQEAALYQQQLPPHVSVLTHIEAQGITAKTVYVDLNFTKPKDSGAAWDSRMDFNDAMGTAISRAVSGVVIIENGQFSLRNTLNTNLSSTVADTSKDLVQFREDAENSLNNAARALKAITGQPFSFSQPAPQNIQPTSQQTSSPTPTALNNQPVSPEGEIVSDEEFIIPEGLAQQPTEAPTPTKSPEQVKIENEIEELKKKDFLAKNDGNVVTINSVRGTLKILNDYRIEVETSDKIYEYTVDQIESYSAPVEPAAKYAVENISENTVTVNGTEYTINTDTKGNIESLSPTNTPAQKIRNEKLIIAVEIERNKMEVLNQPTTSKSVNTVLDENNYTNLKVLLDTIYSVNYTKVIEGALDKLYRDSQLSENEALQLSLWLQDAFDRLSKLFSPSNTKQETELLLNAYDNLETILSLLYSKPLKQTSKKHKQDANNNVGKTQVEHTSERSKREAAKKQPTETKQKSKLEQQIEEKTAELEEVKRKEKEKTRQVDTVPTATPKQTALTQSEVQQAAPTQPVIQPTVSEEAPRHRMVEVQVHNLPAQAPSDVSENKQGVIAKVKSGNTELWVLFGPANEEQNAGKYAVYSVISREDTSTGLLTVFPDLIEKAKNAKAVTLNKGSFNSARFNLEDIAEAIIEDGVVITNSTALYFDYGRHQGDYKYSNVDNIFGELIEALAPTATPKEQEAIREQLYQSEFKIFTKKEMTTANVAGGRSGKVYLITPNVKYRGKDLGSFSIEYEPPALTSGSPAIVRLKDLATAVKELSTELGNVNPNSFFNTKQYNDLLEAYVSSSLMAEMGEDNTLQIVRNPNAAPFSEHKLVKGLKLSQETVDKVETNLNKIAHLIYRATTKTRSVTRAEYEQIKKSLGMANVSDFTPLKGDTNVGPAQKGTFNTVQVNERSGNSYSTPYKAPTLVKNEGPAAAAWRAINVSNEFINGKTFRVTKNEVTTINGVRTNKPTQVIKALNTDTESVSDMYKPMKDMIKDFSIAVRDYLENNSSGKVRKVYRNMSVTGLQMVRDMTYSYEDLYDFIVKHIVGEDNSPSVYVRQIMADHPEAGITPETFDFMGMKNKFAKSPVKFSDLQYLIENPQEYRTPAQRTSEGNVKINDTSLTNLSTKAQRDEANDTLRTELRSINGSNVTVTNQLQETTQQEQVEETPEEANLPSFTSLFSSRTLPIETEEDSAFFDDFDDVKEQRIPSEEISLDDAVGNTYVINVPMEVLPEEIQAQYRGLDVGDAFTIAWDGNEFGVYLVEEGFTVDTGLLIDEKGELKPFVNGRSLGYHKLENPYLSNLSSRSLKGLLSLSTAKEELGGRIKEQRVSTDNAVDYSFRAVDRIKENIDGILSFEKRLSSKEFWHKIQNKYGLPSNQLELIKESKGDTFEDKFFSFLSTFSFTVETNVTKGNTGFFAHFSTAGFPEVYTADGNWVSNHNTIEEAKAEAQRLSSESSFYADMTVPGGTNYRENEIATPLITPSIKGHAQFSTDNGIGWFRSDEQQNTTGKGNLIQDGLNDDGSPNMIEASDDFIPVKTKTRRILEVQSDLFQKGRNKSDLVSDLITPTTDTITVKGRTYTKIVNEFVELWEDSSGRQFGDELIEEWREENSKAESNENQFLQLLNKDNNWVTFFTKSIIQDSAKKGYEKVLFPTGDTASKVEGHITLEEFKKLKQDRIKELEKQKENIKKEKIAFEDKLDKVIRFRPKNYDSSFEQEYFAKSIKEAKTKNWWVEDYYETEDVTEEFNKIRNEKAKTGTFEKSLNEKDNEINQLKQELERVETEGLGALKPIWTFYEKIVANILNKQFGKTNIKQVTDEYGNTWNELEIVPSRDLDFIKLQKLSNIATQLDNKHHEAIHKIAVSLERRLGIPVVFINDKKQRIRGRIVTKDGARRAEINLHYANLDTPIHEIFGHPVIEVIKESRPLLYQRLLSELEEGEGKVTLAKVAKLYPDLPQSEQQEEALVQLLGEMAAGKLTKETGLVRQLTSLLSAIKDFIKSVFTGNTVAIDKLSDSVTLNELANIAIGNKNVQLRSPEAQFNALKDRLSKGVITLDKFGEEYKKLCK